MENPRIHIIRIRLNPHHHQLLGITNHILRGLEGRPPVCRAYTRAGIVETFIFCGGSSTPFLHGMGSGRVHTIEVNGEDMVCGLG
jgi:hypothetical protein